MSIALLSVPVDFDYDYEWQLVDHLDGVADEDLGSCRYEDDPYDTWAEKVIDYQ